MTKRSKGGYCQKNVKLSSENGRWHLRKLSIAKLQNINSAPCYVQYVLDIV